MLMLMLGLDNMSNPMRAPHPRILVFMLLLAAPYC